MPLVTPEYADVESIPEGSISRHFHDDASSSHTIYHGDGWVNLNGLAIGVNTVAPVDIVLLTSAVCTLGIPPLFGTTGPGPLVRFWLAGHSHTFTLGSGRASPYRETYEEKIAEDPITGEPIYAPRERRFETPVFYTAAKKDLPADNYTIRVQGNTFSTNDDQERVHFYNRALDVLVLVK